MIGVVGDVCSRSEGSATIVRNNYVEVLMGVEQLARDGEIERN